MIQGRGCEQSHTFSENPMKKCPLALDVNLIAENAAHWFPGEFIASLSRVYERNRIIELVQTLRRLPRQQQGIGINRMLEEFLVEVSVYHNHGNPVGSEWAGWKSNRPQSLTFQE
jgi:hypothetical protein